MLSTFIKLPFVIKIFVLSIFECPFYTGFTVFTSRVENIVDPDQLASQKPADLDLLCFQNGIYLSRYIMVKVK